MNTFITGIGGFIGGALAMNLSARGHRVFGSVSRSERISQAPRCAVQCYVVRLNEDFDPTIFREIDVLVHCAHDFTKGRSEANLGGTKQLADAAARQGVKRQIFISSYSAHQLASSEYGRTKLALEQFFIQSNHTVAKAGLVIGDGGLFSKLCGFFQRYPLVPLIDGGRGMVPVISLADLTDSIAELIEQPQAGVFRFHYAQLVTLKELLQRIRSAGNFRTVMVPVSLPMVDFGVRLLEKFGISLQIDSENLKGFRANQNAYAPTDLNRFVARPMTLGESIEVAFERAGTTRRNYQEKYSRAQQNK